MSSLSCSFQNVLLHRDDDHKLRIFIFDEYDKKTLHSLYMANSNDLLYNDWDLDLETLRKANNLNIENHDDETLSFVLTTTTNLNKDKLKDIQFEGKRYGCKLTFKKRHSESYKPLFHLQQLYRPTPEKNVENDDTIEEEKEEPEATESLNEDTPVIDPNTFTAWKNSVSQQALQVVQQVQALKNKIDESVQSSETLFSHQAILKELENVLYRVSDNMKKDDTVEQEENSL